MMAMTQGSYAASALMTPGQMRQDAISLIVKTSRYKFDSVMVQLKRPG